MVVAVRTGVEAAVVMQAVLTIPKAAVVPLVTRLALLIVKIVLITLGVVDVQDPLVAQVVEQVVIRHVLKIAKVIVVMAVHQIAEKGVLQLAKQDVVVNVTGLVVVHAISNVPLAA